MNPFNLSPGNLIAYGSFGDFPSVTIGNLTFTSGPPGNSFIHSLTIMVIDSFHTSTAVYVSVQVGIYYLVGLSQFTDESPYLFWPQTTFKYSISQKNTHWPGGGW